MSKAPFYPGWIVLIKHAHTHSVEDRDGASSADVRAPPLSRLPTTQSWVSFQSLAQSSIQSLPLTDAHLACKWTEKRKKASQCFSHLPGKAWEFLPYLPASTEAEKQIRKSPMVSFTLQNWVNETLWVKPSMHKSQEIQACHSHSPWRPCTCRWLCPCPGHEQHPCRSVEPRCKSARFRGFGQGKNGHHLHYITISTRKLFVYF